MGLEESEAFCWDACFAHAPSGRISSRMVLRNDTIPQRLIIELIYILYIYGILLHIVSVHGITWYSYYTSYIILDGYNHTIIYIYIVYILHVQYI